MEAARALGRAPDDRPTLHALGRPRPGREEIEALLPDLIERRGREILAHARRFASSPEDAEDAYQRGLEILLTKAPATAEDELVPWLKTVVKHEAFAITRSRGRAGIPAEESLRHSPAQEPAPDEQAERYERLRTGAEAISRLKPHEIQAMLLRAEGHSYAEIQLMTGWTYTKVDRCLKEGRKSFVRHVQGIETGAECSALEPVLSRFADGEAPAEEVVRLRRHLRACPGCRSVLGAYRIAPRQVAALAPPLAAVAAGGELAGSGDGPGLAQRAYEAASVWLHDKSMLLGVKVQTAAEATGIGKVAAVAASSVALAGGGVVAAERIQERERPEHGPAPAVVREAPAPPATDPIVPPAPEAPAHDDGTSAANDRSPAREESREAEREPEPEPEPEPVVVQDEFAPSPAEPPGQGSGASGRGGGGSHSGGGGGGSGGGGGGSSEGGEFAP